MAPEDRLQSARCRTVGVKQTLKAVERGQATVVFIARDAEERVTRDLVRACQQAGVEIVYTDSMARLGRACGIEVGASAAAIVEA